MYIERYPTLNDSTPNYSWHDHSVTFRSLHLFQTVANESDLPNPDIHFIEKAFNHIDITIDFMLGPKH